ncbi:MAG: hypothetical protein ACYSUL_00810, partial [Planctomycetota bacterium]
DNIYNLSQKLLSYKDKCLSRVYLECAKKYLKAGKIREAEDFFIQSKRLSFWNYISDRYF